MLDPCVDPLGLAVDFGLLLTAQDQVACCDQRREPEVRTIAASPVANFGFKAALESESC